MDAARGDGPAEKSVTTAAIVCVTVKANISLVSAGAWSCDVQP